MSAQLAPNFTLEHIAGRTVSLSDYRGRPVVVIVGGRDSSEQVREINISIRKRFGWDRWEQVPIVSVIDLSVLPRLARPIAKGRLQSGFQDGVKGAQQGFQAVGRQVPADPSQVIVMLPDWEGVVAKSYGLSGVDKQAVAILIDENGYIRGYGAGAQGGEQILTLFN